MAVVNVKSAAIALNDTPNPTEMPLITTTGRVNQTVALIAATAGDQAGSTYRVARVPSNVRIAEILTSNDALGGTAAVAIGVYDVTANGGAVVSLGIFTGGISVVSASNAFTTRYPTSSAHLAAMEKRLWEILGLPRDPGKAYDIVVTLNADVATSGNIGVRVNLVQGN